MILVQEESSVSARDEVLETIMKVEDRTATHLQNPGTHHGRFAGVRILQQIRALCGQIGHDQADVENTTNADFMQAFDSVSLPQPFEEGANYALLPSKERLLQRVDMAIDQALNLMYFIDRVSLEPKIDRLYDLDGDQYSNDDRKTLALVYALLAIARQFETDDSHTANAGAQKGVTRGFVTLRKFKAAGKRLQYLGFTISEPVDRVWTSLIVMTPPLCKLYFAWFCTSKRPQPCLRPTRIFALLLRQRSAWVFKCLHIIRIYLSMRPPRDGKSLQCSA